MDPLQLHKVLVPQEDWYRLLRAIYADDRDLLLRFNVNIAKGLDIVVALTMDQLAGGQLYKTEMPDGTLTGYLIKTFDGILVFLRPQFRAQLYKDAMTILVESIVSNSLYSSTGRNNYADGNALNNLHEIKNISFDFNVKNFVFSDASI